VVAAVALASVPVASAADRPGSVNLGKAAHHNDKKQNKKIKKAQKKANKAHRRISNLKEWNQSLSDWNTSQQSSIESIEGTVAQIVAGVPTITNALTQLQGGLLAIQAALEGPIQTAFNDIEDGFAEVEDALNDPTTGLFGLNLARPQFGVFNPVGTFQGGTGPVNGSDPPHGPDGDAAALGSTYVVDFNNDVSSRMYSVNVFPGAGPALAASAINCALAAASCNGISAGTGDTSHVLVKVGTGAQATNGADFGGFSVTAISG
jgi:hypothetical protein